MNPIKVRRYRMPYTGVSVTLCARHAHIARHQLGNVEWGEHWGECDACPRAAIPKAEGSAPAK